MTDKHKDHPDGVDEVLNPNESIDEMLNRHDQWSKGSQRRKKVDETLDRFESEILKHKPEEETPKPTLPWKQGDPLPEGAIPGNKGGWLLPPKKGEKRALGKPKLRDIRYTRGYADGKREGIRNAKHVLQQAQNWTDWGESRKKMIDIFGADLITNLAEGLTSTDVKLKRDYTLSIFDKIVPSLKPLDTKDLPKDEETQADAQIARNLLNRILEKMDGKEK